jgi:hypothetical protein
MQLAFEEDAEGRVLFMATSLGSRREEVTLFLAHFRREIRNTDIHSCFKQKVSSLGEEARRGLRGST